MDDYGGNYVTSYMADLYYSWWVLLICAFLSFINGFIYLLFVRCCIKPLIAFTIIAGFFIFLGIAIFLYFTSFKYESTDKTRNYMQYASYTMFGLSALYVLVVICCIRRIFLGMAIITATSKYIGRTPQVFIIPILFFCIILVWITFWVITAIFIWSVGEVKKRSGTPFSKITWTSTTRYVYLYDIFGLFWVNAYIAGCAQFIMAVGVITWYFSHEADKSGKAKLWKGFLWIAVYHWGTIVFGSLIIAIARMLQFLFERFRKSLTGVIF